MDIFDVFLDFLGDAGPSTIGIPLHASVAEACNESGWFLPSSRSRNTVIMELRLYLLSIIPPNDSRGMDFSPVVLRVREKSFFSTKVTWNYLRFSATRKHWAKAVWHKNGVSKHSFTFWIANLDRLPTWTRLMAWGLTSSLLLDACVTWLPNLVIICYSTACFLRWFGRRY